MIEISNNPFSLKQFLSMAKKKTVRFDYPIQRAGGQWKLQQQSYLVHSMAYSGFPIPPIYAVSYVQPVSEEDKKEYTVRYVLDGKQRITTMLSYMNNEFATIQNLDPVFVDGDEYDISGKFFEELDPLVQDSIESKTLLTYTINGKLATDEEIEDMFYRMNNGTQLSKSQQAKAKMGIAWSERLRELSEHIVVKEYSAFSKAQIDSEKHTSAILQAMMMLDDYSYQNVSEQVIAQYSSTFKEDEENKLVLLETIKDAMDYLGQALDEKEKVLMKKVHFPMMLTTAVMALEKGIDIVDFKNWMPFFKEEFKKKEIETPSDNSLSTNYFDYTGKGSTNLNKADGRMKEMARHLTAFVIKRQSDEALQGYMNADSDVDKAFPF